MGLLALSFCGSWFTAEAGIEWFDYHFYFGYATLGLILFRIFWGLWGTAYARFSQFLVGPGTFLRGLRHLFSRTATQQPGHSATGGWAAFVLMLLCLVQASRGLFITRHLLLRSIQQRGLQRYRRHAGLCAPHQLYVAAGVHRPAPRNHTLVRVS